MIKACKKQKQLLISFYIVEKKIFSANFSRENYPISNNDLLYQSLKFESKKADTWSFCIQMFFSQDTHRRGTTLPFCGKFHFWPWIFLWIWGSHPQCYCYYPCCCHPIVTSLNASLYFYFDKGKFRPRSFRPVLLVTHQENIINT